MVSKKNLTLWLFWIGIVIILIAVLSYWSTFSFFGKFVLVLGGLSILTSFIIKGIDKLNN